MIVQNIELLRERIRSTCIRCGRRYEDVRLVAVTKTFSVEMIREAVTAGLLDYGENYVQELQEKRAQLPDPSLRWHFIGRLQTNKVKYVADFIHLVHSVDNERLAREIDKRGAQKNRVIDTLIEVHTTDEATKSGAMPGEVMELIKRIAPLDHIRIKGLMTMGPFSDNPNDSRPSFQHLSALKRQIEREGIDRVSMNDLSMGMTHDFEVAIEEGATLIRIGTAIFGERMK